jgi:hypothetical protein
MAMSYRIDGRQRCVFVKLYDTLDDWSLAGKALELLEDARFNSEFARLVDATEVKEATIGSGVLEAIAEDFRRKSSGKVALLGTTDTVLQLLSRYQDALKGIDCRVFRDKQEALGWLGVSGVSAEEASGGV